MTGFEMFSYGCLGGMIGTMLMILVGIIKDVKEHDELIKRRNDELQIRDDDVRIYVPRGSRSRGSNIRRIEQMAEEMNIKIGED